MEEEIEELLKRKDDYDFAYGTQIYKPYTMSEKDWELIENLLTRYKQMEAELEKKDKEIEYWKEQAEGYSGLAKQIQEEYENRIDEFVNRDRFE